MKIPDKKELNKTTLRENIFKKKWLEFYSFLMDNYKDCNSLSEKLYLYYNRLDKRPVCEVCGTSVGFDGFVRGFRRTCCMKCLGKNPVYKLKRIQTNLKKYGVENISQNEYIKEKTKQTNLERYGVETPTQNEYIKEKTRQTNLERYGVEHSLQNKYVREKAKQTNLKKYGTEYSLQNKYVREKAKQTNLKRYGAENPFSSSIIKEKIKQTNQKTNIENHPDLLRYTEDGDWICKCPHLECDKCVEKEYIIDNINHYNRKIQNTEPCTKLLPIQSLYSTPELQIRSFLDSLNIEYITNDRSIITPKELDIYIPLKKMAIEFNGSYWHSNKDKYYHQNKTKACYSKGILLVHIYEYEWNANKESILSKLKDILEDKEVDGIVPVKDYDKYTLSEPVLIDCGSYKIWNEGDWVLKKEL